jgi:glycerol-3-phosphate acyltransferase PlsY
VRALILPLAYLLGSVPFSSLAARWRRGKDLRQLGSASLGPTKTPWALAVVLLDMGKGALALWLARQLTGNPLWHSAAACAAVVGHCFPFWLSFRGGKGLAPSAGALLLLSPLTLALAAALWVAVFLPTRVLALGSAAAAAALPVMYWWIQRPTFWGQLPLVLWSLVVLGRHRENLQRWVRGEEPKVGGRP